jgi:hypothetical protein
MKKSKACVRQLLEKDKRSRKAGKYTWRMRIIHGGGLDSITHNLGLFGGWM